MVGGSNYINQTKTAIRHQFTNSSLQNNKEKKIKMFGFVKVFIAAVALLVVAQAGYLEGGYGGGEIAYGGGYDGGYGGGQDDGHYEHPKYKFNYAVHDPHTGDEKQHIEERDGDEVKGTYSLKEADGTTRVVEYKADKHNGFNAVVHKIGHAQHGGNVGSGYGGHY